MARCRKVWSIELQPRCGELLSKRLHTMKPLLSFLLFTTGITHAADLSFTLNNPGNVSAAIYDAHGRLVRELLHAEPMQGGKHTLA